MELDGIFLDFYGTIATGDRQAVEAVCAHVIRDTGLDMTPHDLAIVWGDRFFAAADACVNDGFPHVARHRAGHVAGHARRPRAHDRSRAILARVSSIPA